MFTSSTFFKISMIYKDFQIALCTPSSRASIIIFHMSNLCSLYKNMKNAAFFYRTADSQSNIIKSRIIIIVCYYFIPG